MACGTSKHNTSIEFITNKIPPNRQKRVVYL